MALQHDLPGTCYVDPEQPTHSVLVRELPLRAYRGFGLAIVLGGALLLLWSRSVWSGRVTPPRWFDSIAAALPVWIVRGTAALVLLVALRMITPVKGGGQILLAIAFASLAVGLSFLQPAVLQCGAGLAVAIALCLPFLALFGIVDVNRDAIHEPGFMVDYFLQWLSTSLCLLAVAYMAVIVAKAQRKARA